MVAVIGQQGSHDDGPCELWFLVASRKSNSSDGFIEGFYLYEVDADDDTHTHKKYELHSDDKPVVIAKASVISIVKDCNCDSGIYSISTSTIEDLTIILSFEDDSNPKGRNLPVLAPTSVSQKSCTPLDEETIAAALSRAMTWKAKVRASYIVIVT